MHGGTKCRSRAGQAPEQGKQLCYRCLKCDEHGTGEEDEGVLGYVHGGTKC